MQHVQYFTNHSIPKWLTLACFQGLVCKLVNFKMKQHNAEKRAILRYVSGREKQKLQMTMTCYISF